MCYLFLLKRIIIVKQEIMQQNNRLAKTICLNMYAK